MRASRRLPHASSWLDELVEDPTVHSELDRNARTLALQKALGKLPSRACEILRLHFHEGLTHEQIANRLGVSQRVVKRDIVNAYASLRVELSAHGGAAAHTGAMMPGATETE
jgi:RNA polymerase sigma-70 factor (ECF subfamily)